MGRHAFGSVLQAVAIVALTTGPMVVSAETWRVGLHSAGKLQIGTDLEQLPVALQQPLARTELDPSGTCFYAEPRSNHKLKLMILREHLARFDVYEPGIATVEGVQVGDPVEKLQRAYGAKLTSAPNFYSEDELDYTVKSSDGRYAIRFESRAGTVSSFFAGEAKAVAFVEGCL